MLSARSVSIRRGRRLVLQDVELTLAPGEVLGVLGPNGAGKSTLIAALSGELAATAGVVELDGLALDRIAPEKRARRIAVVPQASRLDFSFAVREVVKLGRYPHRAHASRKDDDLAVERALAAMDLCALARRDYMALSGGEQQRCQIARVLAQIDGAPKDRAQSRYVLLDEPTASLDIHHQAACLTVMRGLARTGLGVLAALHDLNLAALYADRVVLMSQGRIVANASPDRALSVDLLERVYGVAMLRVMHPTRPTVPQFFGAAP